MFLNKSNPNHHCDDANAPCSCAEIKAKNAQTPALLRRFNSYRKCRCSHLHTQTVLDIHKYVNICFINCVLKILSFKDCLVYQNSFPQIPKSQPDYISYMFLNFFRILSLMLFKSMFLKIKRMCIKLGSRSAWKYQKLVLTLQTRKSTFIIHRLTCICTTLSLFPPKK